VRKPLEVCWIPEVHGLGVSAIAVVRDLTVRQNAERALNDARATAQRANRAKTHLLRAAGRDLRQPLQAIGPREPLSAQ